MFIRYISGRIFYRFLVFVNNVDLQTVQLDMTKYIKMTEWILSKTSFWGSEQFHTLILFKLFCSDCTPWIRDVKFANYRGYVEAQNWISWLNNISPVLINNKKTKCDFQIPISLELNVKDFVSNYEFCQIKPSKCEISKENCIDWCWKGIESFHKLEVLNLYIFST